MKGFNKYTIPAGGVFVKDPTKVITVMVQHNELFDGQNKRIEAQNGIETLWKLGRIKKKRRDQLFKLAESESMENIDMVLNFIKSKL
jgi:hypothetical protein